MGSPEPAIWQRLQHHSLGLHCAECQTAVPVAPRHLLAALIAGAAVHCPACDAAYDIWNRMLDQLKFGVFGSRYAAVGANVVVGEVRLQRDQSIVLDFQKLGIPETAEIEEIAMTPMGSDEGWLHPVFLRDPGPGHPASEKAVVHPVPMSGGAEENQTSMLVVWTEPGGLEPAQHALLTGVRAAHRRDHLGAIMSSSAAMELALGLALTCWLKSHGIGRDRRSQFLASQATYGSQLSVLLPVAAGTVGLRPVPERVEAALARLRKLRNDVAHRGLQAAAIDDAAIAECLAGAAVGVAYCEALTTALS